MDRDTQETNLTTIKRELQKKIVGGNIQRYNGATAIPLIGRDRRNSLYSSWPLLLAAILYDCKPQLLQALLKKGEKVDDLWEGLPILYPVAKWSNFEGIKFLLDNGANAKEAKKKAMSKDHNSGPYILEAIFGNTKLKDNEKEELVKTLVDKGVDINTTNSTKDTLLHRFIADDNHECVAILLRMGDKIQPSLLQTNAHGKTPWEAAADKEHIALAKQMIGLLKPAKDKKRLIKRLIKYKDTAHWDDLQQAFIANKNLKITAEEIQTAITKSNNIFQKLLPSRGT